jgi:hypothetical protein
VDPELLEKAVTTKSDLIDLFQNDLKACNKLVDTLVAVVLNEITAATYRGLGLSPAMGFGAGKVFDSDLSNASGMRTALTNIGGYFLSTAANRTLRSSESIAKATKALNSCTEAVLNNPKYNALAEDPSFLELVSGIDELRPEFKKRVGANFFVLKALTDCLEGATPELTEACKNAKTAVKIAVWCSAGAAGSNAYHGYKRNDGSIGYGLLWLIFGGFVGVGQSIAQGYAKNIN